MKEIVCADCGKLKKHQGHGLCKTCLQREYRGSLPNDLRKKMTQTKKRIALIAFRDSRANDFEDESEFVNSLLHKDFC
jgi:hypothetical protein